MVCRRMAQSAGLVLAAGLLIGCTLREKELHYLGDAELQYYKDAATQVDYPHVHESVPPEVSFSSKPRTVLDRQRDAIWELSLSEAVHTSLSNNSVIRARVRSPNQFAGLGFSSAILTSPDRVPSVYDPAIQESGVLFGGRGMEAALAAFDAQFSTQILWGRNATSQNNFFSGGGVDPGSTLTQETAAFTSQLAKNFAFGGQFAVNHNWNYLGSDAPGQLFPSAYSGVLAAQYRHPLLAGSGAEFTRIAGPIAQSFGGLTGVSQGTVIARINNDVSIADFEMNVRNLLKTVEDVYWNLYLSYRVFDTAISARDSALRTWREAKAKLDIGGVRNFKPADEAQARDRYFETRSQTELALADIYTNEAELRRLMGLPVNDGRIIRPADEPIIARFVPDWEDSLADALAGRVELRRQKWQIKSLELQLKASHSLTRPRLDFVSGYQVNALGDELIAADDGGPAKGGLNSAYGALTQGDHTGWNLGFELTMPLGFRSAHAQVRNIELRLAKARDVLATQEMEISHELADAFQSVALYYVTAQSSFNRRRAAQRRVQLFEAEVRAGTQTLDLLLRAQASLADAEVVYYSSLVQYNQSIAYLHFAKGMLLEMNNVFLGEGDWDHVAYHDALRRAQARSHAFKAPYLHTEPEAFTAECFDCCEDEGVLPASDSSYDEDTTAAEPPTVPPAEIGDFLKEERPVPIPPPNAEQPDD